MEKFTFFWSGPFSQWYKSDFMIHVPTAEGPKTMKFNCAEQYMMYMKAAHMADWTTAAKIMATSNPKDQKALGRQVKPFNAAKWSSVAKGVVYEGNAAKFGQSTVLMSALMATRGTTLVEASPYDKIWGIGLAEEDPRAKNRATWQGTNWLGEVLTQLREDFIKQVKEEKERERNH